MEIYQSKLRAPFGEISILANKNGLVRVLLPSRSLDTYFFLDEATILAGEENGITQKAKEQLKDYFNGKLKQFDIPIDLLGTSFQIKVWEKLKQIPFGTTWSYYNLAEAVGNNKAMRAVGNANGKNPIPIIIPCHRVIQKNGKLGGYSGGLNIKEWLLQHEGISI